MMDPVLIIDALRIRHSFSFCSFPRSRHFEIVSGRTADVFRDLLDVSGPRSGHM